MSKLLETFQELNLSNYGPDDVDQLNAWAIDAYAELSTLKAQEPVSYTYASKQETQCAGCGIRKHTPLRVDEMGGYVCLTCIDKKLEDFYASPVSEAKAQGVVMPPPPYMPEVEPAQLTDYERGEAQGRCDMWAEVARLNAAPVQQVVPECFTKLLHHAHGMTLGADWNKGTMAGYHREPLGEAVVQCQAWIAADPAAPAADACKACKGTGRRPIGGRGRIFGLTNRCFECQPLTDEEVYGQVTAHE